MVRAWGNLKIELTCAQHEVPTTFEKVLDLSLETLASGGELQKYLKTVEGEALKDIEKYEELLAELRDARLKLDLRIDL